MLTPQTIPTPRQDSIVQLLGPNGTVDVASLVVRFRTTKGHLAELVGVSPDSLYKTGRSASPKTQARLREMLEILVRISGWAGGLEQALAWYKAQPIPAFGDRTAESLVKDGYAGALRDYFDGLALGGFA
jgi:hypothetical protein